MLARWKQGLGLNTTDTISLVASSDNVSAESTDNTWDFIKVPEFPTHATTLPGIYLSVCPSLDFVVVFGKMDKAVQYQDNRRVSGFIIMMV